MLFIGSMVQWVFCFEMCTPEGRGKFQNKPHRISDPRNSLSPVCSISWWDDTVAAENYFFVMTGKAPETPCSASLCLAHN